MDTIYIKQFICELRAKADQTIKNAEIEYRIEVGKVTAYRETADILELQMTRMEKSRV